MDIGMLWYISERKYKLAEEVARAAAFYRAKYGVAVTDCHLHPDTLGYPAIQRVGAIALHPNHTVLRQHLWLGVGAAHPLQGQEAEQ